jgi:hypothetical protein
VVRRALLLALLFYFGLDLSLPELPGAFVFDPDGSVESVEVARGRLTAEAVVLLVPVRQAPLASQLRQSDLRQRRVATAEFSLSWRDQTNHLPRAAVASPSSPEDPH